MLAPAIYIDNDFPENEEQIEVKPDPVGSLSRLDLLW